jgi:hypothetical protein
VEAGPSACVLSNSALKGLQARRTTRCRRRTQANERRPPLPRPAKRILPMQLQIGDRLSDESGEWEVVGRPYTIGGGKNARVRIQRVGPPESRELRTWGAHERVSVKRA